MAKIIHRPKPEVIVAPDYNQVLQNIKPAQQASMQARAEQEQARSRFEQSLQKAAGKGEQNSPSRGPGLRGDVARLTTNRVIEKQTVPPVMSGLQLPQGNHQQTASLTQPRHQGLTSSTTQQTGNNTQTAGSREAEAREVQNTSAQHSALNSSRPSALSRLASSEEDDGSAEASLETLACPSPLVQEPLPTGNDVAPMAGAGNPGQFETIESMLNHLSLMTARYGPRDWTFEIQNENSSLLSVSMAPADNGGWDVAVTAKPEDQGEAQRYLVELEAMLEDTKLASLNLENPAQDRTANDPDH